MPLLHCFPFPRVSVSFTHTHTSHTNVTQSHPQAPGSPRLNTRRPSTSLSARSQTPRKCRGKTTTSGHKGRLQSTPPQCSRCRLRPRRKDRRSTRQTCPRRRRSLCRPARGPQPTRRRPSPARLPPVPTPTRPRRGPGAGEDPHWPRRRRTRAGAALCRDLHSRGPATGLGRGSKEAIRASTGFRRDAPARHTHTHIYMVLRRKDSAHDAFCTPRIRRCRMGGIGTHALAPVFVACLWSVCRVVGFAFIFCEGI